MVFWLYYKWFLEGKEFHHYNRFYLLSAAVFSIFLPLIRVDWFTIEPKSQEIFAFINYVNGNQAAAARTSSVSILYLTGVLTALISVLLLIRFMYSVYKIQRIKTKYPVEKHENYDLVLTDLEFAPFTFLRNLFWNTEIDTQTSNGKKIFLHELAHISEGHTIDRIFMQTVKSVFWFNPVFYFMHKEIILIHEYLACLLYTSPSPRD